MKKSITIGTRGSDLALKQAEITKQALLAVIPTLDIHIKIIKTEGDINNNPIPLDVIGKGWFTKEIEASLVAGEVDLAVHSLKDVADKTSKGLTLAAFITREDPRDVLVTKNGESLEELRPGATIGTDSLRRQVQMLALRPDLHMTSIRGNVPTRLKKLLSQDFDGLILAAAGLKRLGLEEHIVHHFEINEITPAPGQGTLAIEVRENDMDLRELLSHINDPEVCHLAQVERSFSRAVGGGCKAPVGAYAYRNGEDCTILGMLLDDRGQIIREEISMKWEASQDIGDLLAKKLQEKASLGLKYVSS